MCRTFGLRHGMEEDGVGVLREEERDVVAPKAGDDLEALGSDVSCERSSG